MLATNLPRMVYFFSLLSTTPIVASMTQAELSAIERIWAKFGIHVIIALANVL